MKKLKTIAPTGECLLLSGGSAEFHTPASRFKGRFGACAGLGLALSLHLRTREPFPFPRKGVFLRRPINRAAPASTANKGSSYDWRYRGAASAAAYGNVPEKAFPGRSLNPAIKRRRLSSGNVVPASVIVCAPFWGQLRI